MPEPDLNLLLRQQQEMLERMHDFKDGQDVLTGIVIRLEGATQGMTLELRAMRSQLDRLIRRHDETRARVEKVEEALMQPREGTS